jgi:hypothetical protein
LVRQASAGFGLGAPPNTPAEIIEELKNEISTILADLTVSRPSQRWGVADHARDPPR